MITVRLCTNHQHRDLTLREVLDVDPSNVLERLGIRDIVDQAADVTVHLVRLKGVHIITHVNVPQDQVLLLAVHVHRVDAVRDVAADVILRYFLKLYFAIEKICQ